MKYRFVVKATISLGIEVDAASLEEAIELAQSKGVQGLCHQCAKGAPNEWTTSGELDCGPPGDCELVDIHTDDTAATYACAEELWSDE